MVDYKYWDFVDELEIRQAACLWCGVQPTAAWLSDKINYPQMYPIYQMLEQAWKAGKLKSNNSGRADFEFLLKGDKVANEIVSKADLVRLALELGETPAFLFPKERGKDTNTVATVREGTSEHEPPEEQPADWHIQVENWYRDERVAQHPTDERPPNRDDDLEAAREKFQGWRIGRDFMRTIRAAHAPDDWTAKGAPRNK